MVRAHRRSFPAGHRWLAGNSPDQNAEPAYKTLRFPTNQRLPAQPEAWACEPLKADFCDGRDRPERNQWCNRSWSTLLGDRSCTGSPLLCLVALPHVMSRFSLCSASATHDARAVPQMAMGPHASSSEPWGPIARTFHRRCPMTPSSSILSPLLRVFSPKLIITRLARTGLKRMWGLMVISLPVTRATSE